MRLDDDARTPPPLGPVPFAGGWWSLAGFTVAAALLLVAVNGGRVAVFGADAAPAVDVGVTVLGTGLLGLVAWLTLRHERVGPAEIGLSRRLVVPGVAAVAALWIGVNVVGVGLAWRTGTGGPRGALLDGALGLAVATSVEQLLVVGPVEEFAYRGYLQNKLVDALGGRGDRAAVALGVGTMAVVFAATHLPNLLLVEGLPAAALPGALAQLAVAAVLYAVVYEATGNLVLVGLLHGTFNQLPLVVDPQRWPTEVVIAWLATGVGLLVAVSWLHRRWSDSAGRAGHRGGTPREPDR